jgi:hypothetical protein
MAAKTMSKEKVTLIVQETLEQFKRDLERFLEQKIVDKFLSKVNEHQKALYGNGKEGLITAFAKVESEGEEMYKTLYDTNEGLSSKMIKVEETIKDVPAMRDALNSILLKLGVTAGAACAVGTGVGIVVVILLDRFGLFHLGR